MCSKLRASYIWTISQGEVPLLSSHLATHLASIASLQVSRIREGRRVTERMGGAKDLDPLSRQVTGGTAATATTGGRSFEDGTFNSELVLSFGVYFTKPTELIYSIYRGDQMHQTAAEHTIERRSVLIAASRH